MSEEDKVAVGNSGKDVGSQLIRSGMLQVALGRCKKVADSISYVDNFKDGNKVKPRRSSGCARRTMPLAT